MNGWGANNRAEEKRKKKELEDRLIQIDKEGDRRELFEHEWRERYKIEAEIEQIYAEEEIWWQRRGGQTWLLKGDANTAFFRGVANGRKRKSHIFSIQQGEEILNDPKEIQTHIYDYYRTLFGKEQMSGVHISKKAWESKLRLTQESKDWMVRPFTLEELDKVMKGMKTNSAPGPDGFPVGFYKKMWSHFRGLVKEMLDDLHEGKLNLDRINYGGITLLPKVKDTNIIKQYRPICVQNVILKILTKTVTMRMAEVADEVINWTQTAFIPGRFILDGCVILHEVIHEQKCRGDPGLIFKIDFEKAYDRVHWEFLYEVLEKKNFHSKLIGWIKKINEGGKVCININGKQGPFFKTSRGLRQEDPLSPILFNLVGDALSNILEIASAAGVLEGLVPHLIEGDLTHLQYADDTILFTKATEQNIIVLKFLLFCFEEMSGMKINYQKSEVYVLGVDKEEESFANMLNCKVGQWPLIYLGLPMSKDKITKRDLVPIMQKVEKRMDS